MEKERRSFENYNVINLAKLNTNLKGFMAKEIRKVQDEGLLSIEHHLLSDFGKGVITELHFNNVCISISNLILHDNILIQNKSHKDKLQLSFLLDGEKEICINNRTEKLIYSAQESYMAYIQSYCSCQKLCGNRSFKEVKITLPKGFLEKHGIAEGIQFKTMEDSNLFIPITSDLLAILSDLETSHVSGVSRKIFLEAKVLALLAIQIENYKTIDIQKLENGSRHIKELYMVKQFLKDNLDKNYSLPQLSKALGIHEHVLKTDFKTMFQCSVNQFFTSEKMKRAKYLLRCTQLPIYQISEEVGYKNATHFTAAFKRFYKETPKSFRN